MSVKNVSPALIFDGSAEKAIRLYETAFGAKVEGISRYGDAPPGQPVPAEHKHLIMHSLLRVGQNTLMLMDTTPERGIAKGSNVQIALEFTERDDMIKATETLAAGGQITMPVQKTFWGATFAMLKDAHGIHWMLSAPLK